VYPIEDEMHKIAQFLPTESIAERHNQQIYFATNKRETPMGKFSHIVIIFCITLSNILSAGAILKHRYSFNGNSKDSIGDTELSLSDSLVSISNGKLQLKGGFAEAKNENLEKLSVSLNSSKPVTIEVWYTINQHNQWSKLFCAGSSNNNHLLYTTCVERSNKARPAVKIDRKDKIIDDSEATPLNMQIYATICYDPLTDSMTFHKAVEGRQITKFQSAMGSAKLTDLVVDKFVLGKAIFWNDPNMIGSIDEFRIWEGKLDEGTVVKHYLRGPNDDFSTLSAPTPPLKIVIANRSEKSVKLKWHAVTGAESYTVLVARDSEFTDIVALPNKGITHKSHITINDLSRSSTYYYAVKTNRGEETSTARTGFIRLPYNADSTDGITYYLNGKWKGHENWKTAAVATSGAATDINNDTISKTAFFINQTQKHVVSVLPESHFKMTITPVNKLWAGGKVWIDWNHDGNFDDSTELVGYFGSQAVKNHGWNQVLNRENPNVITIKVPKAAKLPSLPFTTRIRVGVTDMNSYIPSAVNPMDISYNGNIQDYGLTITDDVAEAAGVKMTLSDNNFEWMIRDETGVKAYKLFFKGKNFETIEAAGADIYTLEVPEGVTELRVIYASGKEKTYKVIQ